jgi:Uma2 family endonuclease
MAAIMTYPSSPNEPPRKRWTREECERLAEAGFLIGRYELIGGEIIEKMGQNTPHWTTLVLIAEWLTSVFGFRHTRSQAPITIPGEAGETNAPEPDVAVSTLPVTAYRGRHPGPEDLILVVEVSDTTLSFDLHEKARLYANAGIEDYWVMDTNGRQLYCHRNPTPDGYQSVTIHGEAETVSLLLHPDASVRVSDLLPALEEQPISE